MLYEQQHLDEVVLSGPLRLVLLWWKELLLTGFKAYCSSPFSFSIGGLQTLCQEGCSLGAEEILQVALFLWSTQQQEAGWSSQAEGLV